MEKPQPATYYGAPTAPEGNYPQAGYSPQQGGYTQAGYPTQHGGYPVQGGYPNYPPPVAQPSYPPQSGYQQPPGYPPQSGHDHYPPPSHGVSPLTPYEPPTYGWCEENSRNKPQSNSLAAATFIFTSGGMSLAWSVGFAPVYDYISDSAKTHMQICWFVAVIIGACLSALLIEKISKRIFNLLASLLVITNGILYVSVPDSVTAIVIARYCDGIAFGLTIIPAIVAGSEQSVKRLRGLVLSVEQIGLITGIMLKVIYTNLWSSNWNINSNQMQGILALIYGALALLFTYIFTIESPIFYLRRNNEADAINVLRRLQRPQTVTTETYALLYENKHLLEEDNARGRAVNIATGLMPMVKLCLFRAFVSMSFSLPLTWGFLFASIAAIRSDNLWSLYLYAVMRMIGVIFAIFTLDSLGRKVLTAFSLFVGGGLMIGVGSVFSSVFNVVQQDKMEAVMGLLMAYQVFAGLAAPASTCYLGEAFSVSVKPYFILIAVIFENVIQIIICCCFTGNMNSMSDYGYALGALQIAFAIFFYVAMPETKKTTLREALAKFKKSLNVGTA